MALALVVFAGPGCKHKKDVPITTEFGGAQTSKGSQDMQKTSQDSTGSYPLTDIDMSRLKFEPEANLRPIYFDYDSDALRPDAIATLQSNYKYIKNTPGIVVLIEGHCDERGTQEYNLALGERRAQVTREYLIRLGAPANRLTTVSYGEERPVAMGHNEAAWSQNRRCEFKKAMAN